MNTQEKAFYAEQLQTNPIFKAVFSDIRESLVRRGESSAIGDIDTHHEVILSLQVLKQIQAQLQRYVDDNLVDTHKNEQDTFMRKIRKSFQP